MALYITTRQLTSTDYALFKELILLFEDVFKEENVVIPNPDYLKKLLSNSNFVVYVAIIDNKVVGGLTAYELKKYYAEESEIFLYDIAIHRDHQRKGLGKILLENLNDYCITKGIHEIFVAANEEDAHALDFYRATGGSAEKVVHFNYSAGKKR